MSCGCNEVIILVVVETDVFDLIIGAQTDLTCRDCIVLDLMFIWEFSFFGLICLLEWIIGAQEADSYCRDWFVLYLMFLKKIILKKFVKSVFFLFDLFV